MQELLYSKFLLLFLFHFTGGVTFGFLKLKGDFFFGQGNF